MKLCRFSLLLVLATMMALLYVHQQVQLVKISYEIESNEKAMRTFLDQHRTLLYNVTRLKSPVNLEKRFLAANKEFGVASPWQIVTVPAPQMAPPRQPAPAARPENRAVAFFKALVRPKEALAKTIK